MKKSISTLLCAVLLVSLLCPVFASAAAPEGLTWDGSPATLSDISKNCGYVDFYGEDFVAADGSYKPIWYDCATELWQSGLFLGSDGSFDLDRPLTRSEGVVMTIRLLGKETEAKATTGSISFTDVPDWAKPYVAYAAQNGIANGYNDTTFGANDPMTAAQYITLVLRAMGYRDGEDFTWNKSYDKALELKLIGNCEHTKYSRSNLFMRDDAAGIALNAVFYTPCKSGALLGDTITMPGQPAGTVPTATRTPASDPGVSEGGDFSGFDMVKADDNYTIYSLPGGNYNVVAYYYLNVGTYRGPIDMKVTISPTAVGNTATDHWVVEHDDPNEELSVKYTLSFQLIPAATSATMITNTIKFEAGDFTYTDTITLNGTLTALKVS